MLKIWENKNLVANGEMAGEITDAVVHLDDTMTIWIRDTHKIYYCNVNDIEHDEENVYI